MAFVMVGESSSDFECAPAGRADLERFDAELARLGRGAGALRLQLGEALDALVRMGGHHELGFSSPRAYAFERCERGPRWAAESRALASRLRGLPVLRAALGRGELSWSMVELLARHATPDTESILALQAGGTTVREMRKRIAGPDAAPDAGEAERRRIKLTLERSDAWAFELTRRLVQALNGSRSTDAFVEALLAEALTALQTLDPDAAHGELEGDEEAAARARAWRAQLAAWRDEAEQCAEQTVERCTAPLREDPPPFPVGLTPRDLDRRIRELSAELARRDLTLGRMFQLFREADGWRRLGWATEKQYVEERVGVSHASMKARLTLARRCRRLPAVSRALEGGSIGFEAAALVARVATPQTMTPWVQRARERTLKHLREEVEGVELIARVRGDASDMLPPDDELMEMLAEAERWVLTGGMLRGDAKPTASKPDPEASQMSGGPANDTEGSQMSGAPANDTEASQPSSKPPRLRPGAGKTTIVLDLSAELVEMWRDLERRFHRSRVPGGFVAFLCAATLQSWSHAFNTKEAWAHIYARECFRCKSPVCEARKLTPHHLEFLSQGGTDDDENLAGLCLWCHLEGIHRGRIKAIPPASRIRWVLGRSPILIVDGRRRVQITAA